MANLLAIAELAHNALFPNPREKNAVDLEDLVATAKTEYAAAMWIYRMEQIATDGWFDMASGLLTEAEVTVENNRADISGLNFLSVLPGDLWLQNVGGVGCECPYIKTTFNLQQLLCDDDSLGDARPYYIQKNVIVFPKGAHKKTLPIVYANNALGLDAKHIEVDDYVASKVRMKLMELYGQRMPADITNNQSTDT